ncbi:hypothetical protein D3C80_2007850 [compost metagenome]
MMRKVGMDADPAAVATAVQAADGVPDVGRDAVYREVATAFLRGVQHVDADLLARPAA